MKAWKKLSVCLLTLVLWVGVMAMPVFAEDASLDEVEVTLTTDKESYSQDEEIKATLTISNYNFIPAENISMENLIPEGYKLADGSEAVKTVESLEGEETAVLETVFVKIRPIPPPLLTTIPEKLRQWFRLNHPHLPPVTKTAPLSGSA